MSIQIFNTNCRTDKLQEISNYRSVYVPYIFFRYDMMHSWSTTMQTIFHWHIVDELSFPIEIPSQQKLQNDSYSYSKRCMTSDAIKIVRYIENQGVNVLAGIDVAFHALSRRHSTG